MKKINTFRFAGFIAIFIFIYFLGENLYFYNLINVWILLLATRYQKVKNHLISIILILELLAIISLFTARFYVKVTASLNLIFILIRIIVGEATLGLAVIISLVRSNANRLIMRGIN
jgi:hypothetical protein